MSHPYPRYLPAFNYRGKYLYSLVFTTCERQPHSVTAPVVDLVLQQILRAARAHGFQTVAYCFMPDHLHLLVEGLDGGSDCLAAVYDSPMRYRPFGGTGWDVSEIGYGMWGMAGWSGSDDEESLASLDQAIALGCTFFDTAWAYGDGHSEVLLGRTLKRHAGTRLYSATKIPPKNRKWPARPEYTLDEVYPADYIREYTEKSLTNLGVSTIDLQQFHVWSDTWADDERWQRAASSLKEEGLVRAIGISINRWQPENVLRALDTGLIDAVQVVYNVFDQSPEDLLFPACRERNIAVIARVPFDEGSLTGTLTAQSRWPDGDFRNSYFRPENLRPTLERVERLRPIVPAGMTMPEVALRHILEHPDVSTVIPGMRKPKHVAENIGLSDGRRLSGDVMAELKRHRWERTVDFE